MEKRIILMKNFSFWSYLGYFPFKNFNQICEIKKLEICTKYLECICKLNNF